MRSFRAWVDVRVEALGELAIDDGDDLSVSGLGEHQDLVVSPLGVGRAQGRESVFIIGRAFIAVMIDRKHRAR